MEIPPRAYAGASYHGSHISFFAGLTLDLVGFDESLGGDQSAGVIQSMRLLEIGVPASAFIGAIVLLSFYPLTEKRMETLQKQIRENRASLDETENKS